jgi:hypothetical protein
MTNATTNLAADGAWMTMEGWYQAWKKRAEENAITRMRFAGLRFIVKLRRRSAAGTLNIRRTMGFDEVRL